MWDFDKLRDELTSRVAETSTEFWDSTERDRWLNEAMLYVTTLVGLPISWDTWTADSTQAAQNVPDDFLRPSSSGGYISDGETLSYITTPIANTLDPGWRSRTGKPRWLVYDPVSQTVRVTPKPTGSASFEVSMSYVAISDDMETGADLPFGGDETMSPYIPVVVLYAAYLALEKERSVDAPSVYQRFLTEIRSLNPELGAKPNEPS